MKTKIKYDKATNRYSVTYYFCTYEGKLRKTFISYATLEQAKHFIKDINLKRQIKADIESNKRMIKSHTKNLNKLLKLLKKVG